MYWSTLDLRLALHEARAAAVARLLQQRGLARVAGREEVLEGVGVGLQDAVLTLRGAGRQWEPRWGAAVRARYCTQNLL